MKANLQTKTNVLLNAIASHIKAGKTLRQALEAILPDYNQASPKEQVEIQQQVAELIGKDYKVKPILTRNGTVGFDRKTKAGNAARSMYLYYFPAKPKVKAKPKTNQSVDPVQALLKQFYSLSKTEQKRFDALRAKDAR